MVGNEFLLRYTGISYHSSVLMKMLPEEKQRIAFLYTAGIGSLGLAEKKQLIAMLSSHSDTQALLNEIILMSPSKAEELISVQSMTARFSRFIKQAQ